MVRDKDPVQELEQRGWVRIHIKKDDPILLFTHTKTLSKEQQQKIATYRINFNLDDYNSKIIQL